MAVLVYQGGLANVFSVDTFNPLNRGRNAKRLLQDAFGPCQWFAKGLAANGTLVTSMHCNEAGDIAQRDWSTDVSDAPFFGQMCPVYAGKELGVEEDLDAYGQMKSLDTK
jgi:hypothetical protein